MPVALKVPCSIFDQSGKLLCSDENAAETLCRSQSIASSSTSAVFMAANSSSVKESGPTTIHNTKTKLS
jgi:hypothetical protein